MFLEPFKTETGIFGHYQAQLFGELVWQILVRRHGTGTVKRDVELPVQATKEKYHGHLVADFRVVPEKKSRVPFLLQIITGRNSDVGADLVRFAQNLAKISPAYLETTTIGRIAIAIPIDSNREIRRSVSEAEKLLSETKLEIELWDLKRILGRSRKYLGNSPQDLSVDSLLQVLDRKQLDFNLARSQAIHSRLGIDTTMGAGATAEVVVVVADFCNFSQFVDASQQNPALVAAMMSPFYLQTGRIIEEHGGVLDKFMGDGILAYFSLDTLDRASLVRLSSKLCAVALKIAGEWQDHIDRSIQPIGMRIGAAVGKVFFIHYDSDTGANIEAVGQPINIAARLQAEAEANYLLVSNRLKNDLSLDKSKSVETTAELKNLGQYQYWSFKITPRR